MLMLKKTLTLLLALLLAAVLPACGGGEDKNPESSEPEHSGTSDFEPDPDDPEYPVSAYGYMVNSRPAKVISLAPSITEKLCDLGLGSRLTGISKHCDYPEPVLGLTRYGTSQLPDIEAILADEPHLVLSAARLSDDALDVLRKAGISVVVLPSYSRSLAELEDVYITISEIMDGRTTGNMFGSRFIIDMRKQLDDIVSASEMHDAEDDKRQALYLRKLDFTVATGDTLEGELLELIGYENIASRQSSWTFDADYAKTTEGRGLFRSVDMIFMDERDVNIKMLEQNDFYKGVPRDTGLPATLNDLYIYIDATAFERQSLRMLEELKVMLDKERIAKTRTYSASHVVDDD